MSNQEDLINKLIKDQFGSMSATRKLAGQMMEQTNALSALNKMAHDSAIQALANIRPSHIDDIYKQIGSAQFELLKDFKFPAASIRLAELASQAIIPLSQTYLSQARVAAEAIQSFRAYRTDTAALAIAALRDVDFTRIGGDSISAALAAFQTEQTKGFEALRESFAGIVAGALKQGFESLDERDEQAFDRFEQLINEKIATLPQNQVTADSLWKFLITLFLTLSMMGISAYQIQDAKQSSKTQSEQQIQITHVLERIAISTGRLIPERDQNIYYVAERKVDLKLKPKNSSYTITAITKNQKTRLLQMNHQWIYIEYFDYLEGAPKYGWANKKYFKRVDS